MKKILTSILLLISIPVIGYIYLYVPDDLTQQYLNEKDTKIKMEILVSLMEKGEYQRWSWIDSASKLAYKNKDYVKAREYALESLELSKNYTSDWNYGNSIYNANMTLGRLSLKEGKTEDAKYYLLKGSDNEGSPQLATLGPSLVLANELLKIGEEEAVLKYLAEISKFWEMDNGCINRWIKDIENNKSPKLCNCSC